MSYPSTIATLTNPLATQKLNAPSHSGIETSQNTEITAVETFIGVEGSASIVGTLIYDIRSPASNGGGHVQTANKGGTGQTTYTKGDLLVAQSQSVLSKFAISTTDGLALVADSTQQVGVRWGVPNNKPTIRVFSVAAATSIISSTFTWVKPANLSYIRVKVQGAGAAGASVLGNSKNSPGAGAGGYAEKIIAASVLSSTEQIVVAGAGRISSTITGITSFGITNANASMFSNAGNQPSQQATGVAGSAGGTAFGGDINIQGGPGGVSILDGSIGVGGYGGNSQLGQGGGGSFGTGNQSATQPVGFGSGGAGGSSDTIGTSSPTQGMPGVVIIEEY